MKGDPEYENPEGNVNTVNTTVVVTLPISFAALMVINCWVIDCVGIPEMTPVLSFNDNPIGRLPDWMLKAKESPRSNGVTENSLFVAIVNGESGYEKPDGGVRIVNDILTVTLSITFWALITTDWSTTASEGVPEITPVLAFNDRPLGREPDWTENVRVIVIDCWLVEIEGVPEIAPVLEFKLNPKGSDPDWSENVRVSPVMEGDVVNSLPFPITNGEFKYEKLEGTVSTVNTIVVDMLPTPFSALIVTDCWFTNWIGSPDITPVDVLRVIPEGKEPVWIENIGESPVIDGDFENMAFLAIV